MDAPGWGLQIVALTGKRRQRALQPLGHVRGFFPRRGGPQKSLRGTEWEGSSRPDHLYKQPAGGGTHGCHTADGGGGLSLSQRVAEVAARLQTIHPNPGPQVRRGRRGSQGNRNRREDRRRRRYIRRRRRGRGGIGSEEADRRTNERVIVTWNVQRLSMRDNNRRRLRRVLGYVCLLYTSDAADE